MNTGRMRLIHLREHTEAVGETMSEERERFARLAGQEAPRAVVANNLFQTPPELARRMVEMLPEIQAGGVILEPSAGLGRLYTAIRERFGGHPVALVESSPECCRELYRMTEGDEAARLHQGDFLQHGRRSYAACVMNPPYRRGTDVRHIRHALGLLAPGARLVALCYDGSAQARHLEPIAESWEPLGPGMFRSEGTQAAVVLATFTA